MRETVVVETVKEMVQARGVVEATAVQIVEVVRMAVRGRVEMMVGRLEMMTEENV